MYEGRVASNKCTSQRQRRIHQISWAGCKCTVGWELAWKGGLGLVKSWNGMTAAQIICHQNVKVHGYVPFGDFPSLVVRIVNFDVESTICFVGNINIERRNVGSIG